MITRGDKIAFAIIVMFLILTFVFWKEIKSRFGSEAVVNEVNIKEDKGDKKKDKKDKKVKKEKDNTLVSNSKMMFANKLPYVNGRTAWIS